MTKKKKSIRNASKRYVYILRDRLYGDREMFTSKKDAFKSLLKLQEYYDNIYKMAAWDPNIVRVELGVFLEKRTVWHLMERISEPELKKP